MFENIGGKIKVLGKVMCVIGVIASVIYGIILLKINVLTCIIVIISGSLLSWVGSFFTVGFGELISNSEKEINLLEVIKRNSAYRTFYYIKKDSTHLFRCDKCDSMIDEYPCKVCGYPEKSEE